MFLIPVGLCTAPEVEATVTVAEDAAATVVDVTPGEADEDGAAWTVFTLAALARVVTAATGGLVVDTAVVIVAAVTVTVPGAVVEVSYRGLMFPPT